MKIINRTITALGNPKKSNELKEYNINIISNDIQYKEGIIEYLECNPKVDYVIIDEKIPGNLKINEIIFHIRKINKKIKIILISDSEEKITVHKIIKEPNIKEIAQIINNENVFNKKQIPINDFFSEKTKEAEIIIILGANGIGKTVFSILFAKKQKEKKSLIIDFDILNINLHQLFIINEKNKINSNNNSNYNNNEKHNYNEKNQIKNYIIHSKNNIDFLSGINLIFNSKNQLSPSKIKNIIKKLKTEYDNIMIDTSAESLLEYTKELLNISNRAIFISGANLLEIKKSKRLLEIYNNEWNINKQKINIVFNKYSNNSIDDDVLRNIFKKYNIAGKIKLNQYYDAAINKRLENISSIEKEIEIINKNINNRKLKIKKKRRKHGII